MFWFLTLLVISVKCYVQVQLRKIPNGTHFNYGIPVIVKDYQYNIGIYLDNDEIEYVREESTARHKVAHRQNKDKKNQQFLHGVVEATSVEGYTVEGWKRFILETLFLADKRYKHQLELQLDWLRQKHVQGDQQTDGRMNLSPTIGTNKFFTEIKKSSQLIQEDVFAIYFGIKDSENTIQFGGYEEEYGRFSDGKKFETVKALSNDRWIIPFGRMLFSKQRHNRWSQFVLKGTESRVELSLNTNIMTIRQEVVDKLEVALQSESISCRMETWLKCTNITSIELSLHMFSFKLGEMYANISLYRLVRSCDDKHHECQFNVVVGQDYILGEQFFKEYYTAFDIKNNSVTIALCNKYPQTWFSTVYVARFLLGFGLFIFIGGIVAAFPQLYDNYRNYRKKKSGLEGIELVNRQSVASRQNFDD